MVGSPLKSAFTLLAALAAGCGESPSPDAGATQDAGTLTSKSDAGAGRDAAAAPEGWTLVPPGVFTMGSPVGEPGRSADFEGQHQVTLTHSFLVKTTEVTQEEWLETMGSNPSYFTECGLACPVEYVNWWEALEFCNALSAAQGVAPCYQIGGCTGTTGLDRVCTSVTVTAPGGNPYLCSGYRLPTEAEWEYAARAGTTTAYVTGGFLPNETAGNTCDPVQALESAGWYCGNSTDTPHPVMGKDANAWGLHDTSGNVFEWVWDRYAAYAPGPATDPTGDTDGPLRLLRGGSWSRVAAECRSAARSALDPAERDGDTGVRPVRSVDLP
jgi:formylglycine-generating enzyme required for sulfatase activity